MQIEKYAKLPQHIWVFALLYGVASFIHFSHNAEYIAFYPNMPAWLTREQVYMVWGAISCIGLAAVMLNKLEYRLACLAMLGIYGAFGFDALAHYTLALCSEHSMTMNFTIWFEVLAGAALSGACVWQIVTFRHRPVLDSGLQQNTATSKATEYVQADSVENKLPVLEYLQKSLAGKLRAGDATHMQYPTAISKTLGIRIVEVGSGTATVEIDACPEMHGNQQGTVHGGLMCELADAAIGTAHSTLMKEDESFASIDLKINFFRPVWASRLRAVARPVQSGRTITHYNVDILRDDGKVAATVISTVMTLRGQQAQGR